MDMRFIGMSSIGKNTSHRSNKCTDWVATEKIHGSSYQFYTNDGVTIHSGSRVRYLNEEGSFLKCNTKDFKNRHKAYITRAFQIITEEDRWLKYRETSTGCVEDEDEDDREMTKEDAEHDNNVEYESNPNKNQYTNDTDNAPEIDKEPDVLHIELRIYGELYGGGGVDAPIKPAVQKDIIYADEMRFYVFGVKINRKWLNVTEMNDLCRESGFPYYAIPVTEPKPTIDNLKTWIDVTDFLNSRSRLTERTDDYRTRIEGVVMTPLTRPGFSLHAVKLLSPAFTDVRCVGNNKNQKINYNTKARYNSVLSKLDLPERKEADKVVELYIADILKESGETEISNNKRKSTSKQVKLWLFKDGYIGSEELDNLMQNVSKEEKSKSRRQDGDMSDKQKSETRVKGDGEFAASTSNDFGATEIEEDFALFDLFD